MHKKSKIDFSHGGREVQVVRSVQSLVKEAMHKLHSACDYGTAVGEIYTLMGDALELIEDADRKLCKELPDDLLYGNRKHLSAGMLSPYLEQARIRVKDKRNRKAVGQ